MKIINIANIHHLTFQTKMHERQRKNRRKQCQELLENERAAEKEQVEREKAEKREEERRVKAEQRAEEVRIIEEERRAKVEQRAAEFRKRESARQRRAEESRKLEEARQIEQLKRETNLADCIHGQFTTGSLSMCSTHAVVNQLGGEFGYIYKYGEVSDALFALREKGILGSTHIECIVDDKQKRFYSWFLRKLN